MRYVKNFETQKETKFESRKAAEQAAKKIAGEGFTTRGQNNGQTIYCDQAGTPKAVLVDG